MGEVIRVVFPTKVKASSMFDQAGNASEKDPFQKHACAVAKAMRDGKKFTLRPGTYDDDVAQRTKYDALRQGEAITVTTDIIFEIAKHPQWRQAENEYQENLDFIPGQFFRGYFENGQDEKYNNLFTDCINKVHKLIKTSPISLKPKGLG